MSGVGSSSGPGTGTGYGLAGSGGTGPSTGSAAPPPPAAINNMQVITSLQRAPAKQISGGVMNGKATSLPKPAYPPAARAVKASGAVSIQVTVDESGNIVAASAVSGPNGGREHQTVIPRPPKLLCVIFTHA